MGAVAQVPSSQIALGSLCDSEEGSLVHRHFWCPQTHGAAATNIPGPSRTAAQSGKLWKRESFAARALRPFRAPLERRSQSVHPSCLRRWLGLRGARSRTVPCWLVGSTGAGEPVTRKVKAHTTLESVHTGIVTADDRAGNDLADCACKLVVLTHRAPPFHPGESASTNRLAGEQFR